MRVVLRIARTELQNLFYTPKAWMVFVLFAFQIAIQFSKVFEKLIDTFLTGKPLNNITYQLLVFSERGPGFSEAVSGIFQSAQEYLYMYIPFLTMGLLSRELATDSIKLFYSSPVTNWQIILGKYLAALVMGLMLIAIQFPFIGFGYFTIADFNLPLALSGLLGLYLLICVYLAIGLFMSSMTSRQVVAAISALAILAFSTNVKYIGQEVAWVQNIAYWLSFSMRVDNFIQGFVCVEDIFYFLIISALFLSLNIVCLQAVRQRETWKYTCVRCVGIVLLAGVLSYAVTEAERMDYYDALNSKIGRLDTTILIGRTEADLWTNVLKWVFPSVFVVSSAIILYCRNRK